MTTHVPILHCYHYVHSLRCSKLSSSRALLYKENCLAFADCTSDSQLRAATSKLTSEDSRTIIASTADRTLVVSRTRQRTASTNWQRQQALATQERTETPSVSTKPYQRQFMLCQWRQLHIGKKPIEMRWIGSLRAGGRCPHEQSKLACTPSPRNANAAVLRSEIRISNSNEHSTLRLH